MTPVRKLKVASTLVNKERDKEKVLLAELVKKHDVRLKNLKRDQRQVKRERQRSKAMREPVEQTLVDEDKGYILKLPDEILEMIFVDLDSQDKYNCYRVCERFRNILEPTKVDWLFPLVLPDVGKHLDKNDVLNCRLTCKNWQQSVAQAVDNVGYREKNLTPSHFAENTQSQSHTMTRALTVNLEDSVATPVDKLLHDMENNLVKTPFLGRWVSIDNSFDQDPQYWEKIGWVLEKYGQDIWGCDLMVVNTTNDANNNNVDEEEDEDGHLEREAIKQDAIYLLQTVLQCLARLPNLKKLNLVGQVEPNVMNEDDLNDIRRRLANLQFPSVPQLTEIKLVNPPQLFYHLVPIQFWQQIQKLTVDETVYERIKEASGENLHSWLPSLKNLELEIGHLWFCNCGLSQLELLQCPLEKLKISICASTIDIPCIIQVMNYFGRTLRHVEICWRRLSPFTIAPAKISPRYLESCLNLAAPHVTVLELQKPTESFNFLLSLVSLEYLSINYKSGGRGVVLSVNREDEIIQIYGFGGRMYKSNIWDKLPNLKEFCYITDCMSRRYSRDGYERFWMEQRKDY